jgi:hypothetical protein
LATYSSIRLRLATAHQSVAASRAATTTSAHAVVVTELRSSLPA